MRATFYFSLVVLCFFSGCIEYSEEIWLNADLSGKARLKIGLTQSVKESIGESRSIDNLESIFLLNPGIKLINKKKYTDNGMDVVDVELSFESFSDFFKGQSKANLDSYKIKNSDKGILDISREIKINEENESADQTQFGDMVETVFSAYTWNFTIHFPGKILYSNSDSIDYETNTIHWSYSLYELMNNPFKLEGRSIAIEENIQTIFDWLELEK